MARTSRKNKVDLPIEHTLTKFKVAGYVRLSLVKSGRDSDSLNNQKSIIEDFISSKSDMQLIKFYEDDGYSGTNFNRPSFQQLIEDIRNKKIDCIIVKDLSRFGRNYLEVGNYLENVFPFLNTRFISITENYDSIVEDDACNGFILPFKNLMHELHSKDLSKKMLSIQNQMRANNTYKIPTVPFGYKRSDEDMHKLVVDDNTAWIVKKIFELRSQGLSYKKIMQELNDLNAEPCRKSKVDGVINWHSDSIRCILENEVYLGHIVRGKTKRNFNEGIKKHTVSKDEQYIFYNRLPRKLNRKTK